MPLGVAGWIALGTATVGAVAGADASRSAQNNAKDAAAGAQRSADAATQLGYDQLDFTKQQYADSKDVRDKAAGTAQQVSEAQLAAQTTQNRIASEYDAYNKGTYRPLEQKIVGDATAYDAPEKRQAAADASIADVNSGFAATNDANARRLAANGINPGSTRAMSVMQGQGVEQAKASAGAAYKARMGVESVGHAMQMDAASLGRNLPSNQTATAQTGIQAGNSAVNSSTAGLAATNSGVPAVQAGYSGAVSANVGAGGIYNSAANIAQQGVAQSNASWGALGSTVGRIAQQYLPQPSPGYTIDYGGIGTNNTGGAFHDPSYTSDENMKKDIAPASADDALAAVNATPVRTWRYSPSKMAAAGLPMDDGSEHTGPMAQQVNRTMGEDAAPGGKKIDPITLVGKSMLAIQALDKRVNKLAHLIRSGHVQAGARS